MQNASRHRLNHPSFLLLRVLWISLYPLQSPFSLQRVADAEVVLSACGEVVADMGDSSNKDNDAEVELVAPALKPNLSF